MGKLPIEANLMAAALEEESGDVKSRDLFVQKALDSCSEGGARLCSPDSARRTVAALIAKRHGSKGL